ncbi:MAG: hypothetical protein QNL62_16640 [Gammaproteobacteria bacterium]|nr:hypothetical protein [Gammaproteobacteria bacterium]
MNINLHIDQLVLHGFDQIDRDQVGLAIQRELTRLIIEQGLPASLNQTNTIGNLNAGEFRPSVMTAANTGTNSVGTQVAQKIYRGMQK